MALSMSRLALLALLVTLLVFDPRRGLAQAPINYIRDAEIENTIRTFATPLFKVAGIAPESVHILLVNDPTLNAFVAGGQNLFVHTGLLTRSENANQLIGVIAHETGHIEGGHLVRMRGALEDASGAALLGMLLGAVAGAASGRGDVGAAVALGSQEMAMRNLLSHSRGEESSADQAAIRYLDATKQSSKGLLQFFEILHNQELLVTSRQDPYLMTHPLTTERMDTMRNHVAASPYTDESENPQYAELHRRMKAKLIAFLEPVGTTLRRYRDNDPSVSARYARAIAYYRQPNLNKALPLINGLIAEEPKNPYFHELKGQMLFENGRGGEAVAPYREAVKLLPNNPLLQEQLAQVLIEQEDPALLKEAQKLLTKALTAEPDSVMGWRLQAMAYGRDGNEGMTAYAMAEQALLQGRLAEASFHVKKAEQLLPKTGPVWLRIQDIREQTANAKAEKAR